MAYSMYRSDVGYIHGTHLITAVLLLNLSPSAAFCTLANILNRPVPLAFLTNDEGAINRAYDLTVRAMFYKLPKLYDHLSNVLHLSPETYIQPMFSTLFTRSLPLDITSRIWDVYVFEGDKFLVRTAIAVLGRLEGQLYGSRQEVLDILGWHHTGDWDLGSEDSFMVDVRSAGKEEPRSR